MKLLEAIGLATLGIVEDLVDHGIEPDDMERVTIRQRPRIGMTGKIRDIALLRINRHQLIGHITKLMIEPLIPGAIASDATRKHSGTRADNARKIRCCVIS